MKQDNFTDLHLGLTARHLGQVDDISPSKLSWNGQIGLLYFSR